jgi:hypothetical protein
VSTAIDVADVVADAEGRAFEDRQLGHARRPGRALSQSSRECSARAP